MCGFCNMWVRVCVGFVMCGCSDNCVGVLVICVQVREEYPICVQSQNTTKHKTKFITLLQHYNNMFRPKLSAIFRLYMKPI